MIPRICPVCGKQLSDRATICSRCNQTLPPRAKPISINLQREHIKLYEYLLPAVEDPRNLSNTEQKIKQHLEKYKTILSHDAYRLLDGILANYYINAYSQWKYAKEKASQDATIALASIKAALNQKSTYNGLGFSAITDTAGAVTYAALDAVQGHIHDVTQSAAAYRKALNDISAFNSSSSYSYIAKPIFEAIDKIVEYLTIMVESKQFVDEHRDLYASLWSDTKIGGQYVALALQQAARDSKFIGYYHDARAILLMEAAGYVRVFGTEYYCTTGKFEAEMLQRQFFKAHPEIAAAEKAAIAESNRAHCAQAEISLKENKYYRAATRYAQTTDDRDALRRSIQIWNQKLLQMPEIERGFYLGVDGDPQHIYLSSLSMDRIFEKKVSLDHIIYKQIRGCADGHCVWLSVDGHIYSSAQNIYGDKQLSRSELGTTYLPGNGSNWTNITAIACSGDHLIGLRTDGTVCAVGCNTHGQCNLEGWTDVVSVEAGRNSTAAIKKDGSILLAGAIAEFAPDVRKWSKITQLYLRKEGLVGLCADGRVVAVGKTGFDNQAIARWRNIVRIDWFEDGIFGISDAGDVLYDNRNPLAEMFCRRLSGIVKIVFFEEQSRSFHKKPSMVALRADGTVFAFGINIDVSDWTQIVYVDHHKHYGHYTTHNILAVNANGEFLFKGSDFFDFVRDKKPFSHIDTYADEQRHTLEELVEHKKWLLSQTKGIFAGKQRKAIQSSIDFLLNELARM